MQGFLARLLSVFLLGSASSAFLLRSSPLAPFRQGRRDARSSLLMAEKPLDISLDRDRFVLDNGIECLTVSLKQSSTAMVGMILNVGGNMDVHCPLNFKNKTDDTRMYGVAHLMEHIWTGRDFKVFQASNACVGDAVTTFFEYCNPDNIDDSLEGLVELLTEFNHPSERMLGEIQRIDSEFHYAKAKPIRHSMQAYRQATREWRPYFSIGNLNTLVPPGKLISGKDELLVPGKFSGKANKKKHSSGLADGLTWEELKDRPFEELAEYSRAKLRRTAKAVERHFATFYVPQNIKAFAVADLSLEDLRDAMEDSWGTLNFDSVTVPDKLYPPPQKMRKAPERKEDICDLNWHVDVFAPQSAFDMLTIYYNFNSKVRPVAEEEETRKLTDEQFALREFFLELPKSVQGRYVQVMLNFLTSYLNPVGFINRRAEEVDGPGAVWISDWVPGCKAFSSFGCSDMTSEAISVLTPLGRERAGLVVDAWVEFFDDVRKRARDGWLRDETREFRLALIWKTVQAGQTFLSELDGRESGEVIESISGLFTSSDVAEAFFTKYENDPENFDIKLMEAAFGFLTPLRAVSTLVSNTPAKSGIEEPSGVLSPKLVPDTAKDPFFESVTRRAPLTDVLQAVRNEGRVSKLVLKGQRRPKTEDSNLTSAQRWNDGLFQSDLVMAKKQALERERRQRAREEGLDMEEKGGDFFGGLKKTFKKGVTAVKVAATKDVGSIFTDEDEQNNLNLATGSATEKDRKTAFAETKQRTDLNFLPFTEVVDLRSLDGVYVDSKEGRMWPGGPEVIVYDRTGRDRIQTTWRTVSGSSRANLDFVGLPPPMATPLSLATPTYAETDFFPDPSTVAHLSNPAIVASEKNFAMTAVFAELLNGAFQGRDSARESATKGEKREQDGEKFKGVGRVLQMPSGMACVAQALPAGSLTLRLVGSESPLFSAKEKAQKPLPFDAPFNPEDPDLPEPSGGQERQRHVRTKENLKMEMELLEGDTPPDEGSPRGIRLLPEVDVPKLKGYWLFPNARGVLGRLLELESKWDEFKSGKLMEQAMSRKEDDFETKAEVSARLEARRWARLFLNLRGSFDDARRRVVQRHQVALGNAAVSLEPIYVLKQKLVFEGRVGDAGRRGVGEGWSKLLECVDFVEKGEMSFEEVMDFGVAVLKRHRLQLFVEGRFGDANEAQEQHAWLEQLYEEANVTSPYPANPDSSSAAVGAFFQKRGTNMGTGVGDSPSSSKTPLQLSGFSQNTLTVANRAMRNAPAEAAVDFGSILTPNLPPVPTEETAESKPVEEPSETAALDTDEDLLAAMLGGGAETAGESPGEGGKSESHAGHHQSAGVKLLSESHAAVESDRGHTGKRFPGPSEWTEALPFLSMDPDELEKPWRGSRETRQVLRNSTNPAEANSQLCVALRLTVPPRLSAMDRTLLDKQGEKLGVDRRRAEQLWQFVKDYLYPALSVYWYWWCASDQSGWLSYHAECRFTEIPGHTAPYLLVYAGSSVASASELEHEFHTFFHSFVRSTLKKGFPEAVLRELCPDWTSDELFNWLDAQFGSFESRDRNSVSVEVEGQQNEKNRNHPVVAAYARARQRDTSEAMLERMKGKIRKEYEKLRKQSGGKPIDIRQLMDLDIEMEEA
uniref:Peptidase M16 N-terminal domain-containing protein n=1 Tax=Chromera velia CCMP2878 TaxID=1169474 RepID=A0A0G4G2I1_9ALVE|eukprot:Cvel_19920.t1-p1 / transcript=Cvel_19920.t1 / gene=Cvel_19920 / organism=Chromera_velia_CCMP2878 / gene_product=hypothetical protein / transcript_product=hypothetical protein / location=Cvel_scaffold1752:10342-19812(-) / protein_length=1626 / sequence_SO=supercontig / SO=protein_coding / is_pseudo=false